MLLEKINALGHKNVLAKHKTTLEITKDDHLTPQGDCIVAVSADRGPKEFSKDFLEALKKVKPSASKDIEEMYRQFNEQFRKTRAEEMKDKPVYYG